MQKKIGPKILVLLVTIGSDKLLAEKELKISKLSEENIALNKKISELKRIVSLGRMQINEFLRHQHR